MKKTCCLVLFAIMLAGCTERIVDFTVLSTKNVDLNGSNYKSADRITCEDAVPIVFVVPLGSVDLKEAIDNTIESAGPKCVALADGVVYYEAWYIPFFYGRKAIVVEGTPIMER